MQRKILEELPLRESVVEVFDWALSNNIAMAICTASTAELVNGFLTKHEIREQLVTIISTVISDLKHRKPYPYPYLETMRQLGVGPQETLAIEDSPSGVKSAVAAGIPTIAIYNRFLAAKVLAEKPIYVFEGFPQVLELLCV